MFLILKIPRNESIKLKKLSTFTLLASVLLITEVKAADTAEKFLQALNGEFRGRGEAIVELSNRKERVSCKLDNKFNAQSQVLNIVGICATTQGKAEVEGQLAIMQGSVVGSFLSPFKNSEITKETSDYSDGKLILSTSLVNKDTGNLSRMRQIVESAPGGGFNSTFQKFDNAAGDYQDTGYVEFSPSEN